MNIASWNIRGISDPIKADDVRKICAENGISLIGLLETRVNSLNEDLIKQRIGPRWSFVVNRLARSRMWIGWNPRAWNVQVVV